MAGMGSPELTSYVAVHRDDVLGGVSARHNQRSGIDRPTGESLGRTMWWERRYC
jgi:hypothetical protein